MHGGLPFWSVVAVGVGFLDYRGWFVSDLQAAIVSMYGELPFWGIVAVGVFSLYKNIENNRVLENQTFLLNVSVLYTCWYI